MRRIKRGYDIKVNLCHKGGLLAIPKYINLITEPGEPELDYVNQHVPGSHSGSSEWTDSNGIGAGGSKRGRKEG